MRDPMRRIWHVSNVDPDLAEALRWYCFVTKQSQADVIRQAVRAWLAAHPVPPPGSHDKATAPVTTEDPVS
jgi:hypothetical protein